jgi:hypothetical protein
MDGSQRRPPNGDDDFPEVVEDAIFTARCEELAQGDLPRLDDQLWIIYWAISQNPWRFPLVPGTHLRRVRTREWPGAPRLLIYFTIDGTQRTLRFIERDAEPEA